MSVRGEVAIDSLWGPLKPPEEPGTCAGAYAISSLNLREIPGITFEPTAEQVRALGDEILKRSSMSAVPLTPTEKLQPIVHQIFEASVKTD